MISREFLLKALSYDPMTGVFMWRIRPCSHFIGSRECTRWNKLFANKRVGSHNHHGYLSTVLAGKRYLLHRLAFLYMEGYFPEGEVDHINQIRNDNRWDNLRDVRRLSNLRNKKLYSNNNSGVAGVGYRSESKKWAARITIGEKHNRLGSFHDIFDAICARKSAEVRYGFHINHGKLLAP